MRRSTSPLSRWGAARPAQDAIALVEVDGGIGEKVVADIRKLPLVKQAKALAF